MKENLTSDKDILKELKKTGHLELDPICGNCMRHVMELVLQNIDKFNKKLHMADFGILHIKDNMYILVIDVKEQ